MQVRLSYHPMERPGQTIDMMLHGVRWLRAAVPLPSLDRWVTITELFSSNCNRGETRHKQWYQCWQGNSRERISAGARSNAV